MVTLLVDDLDEHLRALRLAERGVETATVDEMPGAGRSVWVVDPDQNRIQLGRLATRTCLNGVDGRRHHRDTII